MNQDNANKAWDMFREEHPEIRLPFYNPLGILAAMSCFSPAQIARALSEASFLLAEAFSTGARTANQDTRYIIHILKTLYRAFDNTTFSEEEYNKMLDEDSRNFQGLWSRANDPFPGYGV